MVRRQRVSIGIVALLSLAALLLPASARQSKPAAWALTPLVIVAEGLGHLRGVAVDENGAVFVTDAKAGTLLRVAPDGGRTIVMERLRRPVGVAVDREGRLVVVEEGRRHVLRLETAGPPTSLSSGMRHPRWVTAAPDGHLYVTAKRLASEGEEGDDDEVEPELVVRLSPDGIAKVFADRFRGLQGVAVTEDALRAVARGRKGERHPAGTLYEIPVGPDGRAGPVQSVTTGELAGPMGLAADRLGANFVSAKSLAEERWRRGVIVKVAEDGAASLFAAGLDDPQGLAFAPDGSLYLADGNSGRILRFTAPRAPVVDEPPPALTGERQVILGLRAEAGARLTVLGSGFPLVAAADDTGFAVISVPLRRNADNHLLVFATGSTGLGLTSAPLPLSITQDDEPPALELLAPQAGSLLRGTISAEARATDLNGIAGVEFHLDEVTVGFDAAPPFRVSVDTAVMPDGLRVVSALARDRAGNVRSASVPVTVDNTPPEVRIVAPAPGAVGVGPIEVLVEAADVTSGVARVEVAVNGTSRSVAETPPYRFRLDPQEVGPGPRVLQAAAVDRAGNRGESPPVSIVLSGTPVETPGSDLVAVPSSGVAPLTVAFSLRSAPGAAVTVDFDGDGTVDFSGPSLDGQSFTYTGPGIYFPRATITGAQGSQSTVTTVVNVLDRAQMDSFLKSTWNAMKAALIRNDIEAALLLFSPPQQDRFRTLFGLLSTRIAQIAADMQDIELIYLVEGQAKYRLPRTQMYAGQLMTLTYYVYLVQDDGGFWSIE
ncbi:MAG: SMP-30/gluconolactonase/LRE family protein, partial [Candidatus Rokubacteria bacterium]|nr:SMP-30/gluconolactonase/LRE family protein [Candidatus Rokubacteria bacterium]